MIRTPRRFTVLCDGCPAAQHGEYLIAEGEAPARHQVARDHVRLLGWTCNESGDYCPRCKP